MSAAARLRPHAGLLAVLLVFFGLSFGATAHTSTTFDEILPMASGARGWRYGRFDVHLAHPPLAQYSYGLPVVPLVEAYPDQRADWPARLNYGYARAFVGELGNPTERMVRVGRLPAALWGLAGILVVYVGCGGRPRRGALSAALFLALLPDYLAHSGVAYNDVILACTMPLALLMGDRAVRRPSPRRGALAGLCVGLALGTKFSALLLGPLALGVVALEACGRRSRAEWAKQLGLAALVGLTCCYATLVVIERGDVTLELWRAGLEWTLNPELRRIMPSYLFGELRPGSGLFYVVAYLVKLPLALHALVVLGAALFVRARWRTRHGWRRWFRARWRMPLLGVATFVLLFARTEVNNGLRYCLPAFPLLALLFGPVWARAWRRARPAARWAWGGLWGAATLAVVAAYPHYLGYMNALIPVEQRKWVLVESSLDWGQGLIALRDYMQEQRLEAVHLGYFGSAAPASYGIRYRPLPSFLDIPPLPDVPPGDYPVVVSATLLSGLYLPGDPYAAYRDEQPIAVLAGGSLLVYAPRGVNPLPR